MELACSPDESFEGGEGWNLSDRLLNLASSFCRRLPAGRRTAFAACHALAGRPQRFLLRFQDFLFVVDCGDLQSRDTALYGIPEAVTAGLILSQIREGDVIADIGANKGLLSLLMARKAGRSGRVLAYEPDPRNYRDLAINARLNRDRLNVIPIPRAIFSCSGPLPFDRSAWRDRKSGLGRIVEGDAPSGASILVEGVTLDEEMNRLGMPKIDFVKVDIEGGEVEAIKGMWRSLAERRIGALVMELHDFQGGRFHLTREQTEELLGVFQAAGYDGILVDPDDFSESEGRAWLQGAEPSFEHKSQPVSNYSREERNQRSNGRWLRPLQLLFRPGRSLA